MMTIRNWTQLAWRIVETSGQIAADSVKLSLADRLQI